MCWGLYLAIPDESSPPLVPVEWPEHEEGFIAWREPNPWVPVVFGESFSCWVLGHGRYCSCGCIDGETGGGAARLTSLAIKYIAYTAETTANLGFLIHWTDGSYAEEELAFNIITSVSAAELARDPRSRLFKTDAYIWVQGTTGNGSL